MRDAPEHEYAVMRSSVLHKVALLVLLGLAALFGLSSVLKAMDVASFRLVMESHEVLPKGVVPAVSIVVIVIEAVLAILCVSAVLLELTASRRAMRPAEGDVTERQVITNARLCMFTLLSLIAAGTLLTLFTIYALALVILTKNPVECGCGVFGKTVVLPKWIAIRNAIAAACVFSIVFVLNKQRVVSTDGASALSTTTTLPRA